jgi:DNA-binding MarR family transcriptional regulator
MTKKDNRQVIKDMIFNQAASTVADLYAKRNALLAVNEDVSENTVAEDNQLKLISQEELTSQNDLTSLPSQIVNFNSPANLNLPQDGQLNLTSQAKLTKKIVKSISPVNSNSLENGQFKLTSQNQLTKQTSKIAQSLGLSGLGALMILQEIVGKKGAYIRTRSLARELGMTYQGLLNQIDRLTSAGYIVSKPGESALGRWIEITETSQLELASQFKSTVSSSSYIKQQQQSSSQLELASPIELTGLSESPNDDNSDQLSLTSQFKLTCLSSWEKAQLQSQAEELFYIGLAAKSSPESFSMQTLALYSQIVKEHGRDWSAALFLILLPKAKNNVTGYIFSAYKKGAEPTSGSVAKVKDMWTPLETLATVKSSNDLKNRIMEAAEKEDTESLILLTQVQASLKTALKLLSWTGSVDSLIEKKHVFFNTFGFVV